MIDPKWTGTATDRHEMRALKLNQVVRRNFSHIAMFGFASTLLATWESIAVSLSVSLPNGGTAGLFWNYVIGAVGFGFVYASIAELSSMFPTSGGQYYYVAIMAPRRYRRYLSYITGWLCAITWQTGVAGSAYVAGTQIQGLFVLNIDQYDFQRWHGTLLTLAFMALAIIFNTFLAKRLPMVEGLFVILHIIGIVIFIPVWIFSPRAEGGAPFVEFYNPGGWASNGLATLVGASAPAAALIGFDCSVHMAEEARDSSRTVPITLLLGYTTNVILGFFVIITFIYTIGPLDTATSALASPTGYPFIQIFYNATQSFAATNVMTAVTIICEAASAIAALAAASRQLWSFARNRGVPFHKFFAPDHLAWDVPLNAVLVSMTLPLIIALVNIGSTEALGIIISIYNSALLASYMITIACMLLHRLQGRRVPDSRYTLGRWGIACNSIALIYITPIFVFSFFPPTPAPTLDTMNWSIAMVGGITLLATLYYIVLGRYTFDPPNETVEDYIERYEATSVSSEKLPSERAFDEKVPEDNVEEAEKKDI